ncbi:hypothetical protein Glove_543g29 [Diversispora epigaea]|uniref:Uncharacterized protein n=1 Tax=Diversispora epigaea TaxID=1348612 RepID=A0A397GE32_9GLOM|nr:hypothetical protein Glove_543g29 [Diversispora epigaea]
MQWITTKNSISYSQINYKRCWDARVTHRPTFEELFEDKSRINQYNNATTPLNYQTHPAIYTSRLLNYSNLPKPKNKENFERELEELTESFSHNY